MVGDCMRIFLHTISEQDLGKRIVKSKPCQCCGKSEIISTFDLLGRVLACDIGKRVYKINDLLYVENDEQLKARLAHD